VEIAIRCAWLLVRAVSIRASSVARIIHRTVKEKIGHAAQGFDPARDGPVRERGLQLVEQTFGSGGGFRTHNSILEHSDISAGDGFFVAGNETDGSGGDDAVASSCLGYIERAVGAREKCIGGLLRSQ